MNFIVMWFARIAGSGFGRAIAIMTILATGFYQPLVLAAGWQEARQENSGRLSLALYKSTILNFEAPIDQVTVGNPEIIDIIVIDGSNRDRLYIIGKALGTSNILILGNDGSLMESIDIEVEYDMLSLKRNFHDLLPDEDINVYSSQGSIVLRGTVSSLVNLEAALDIAQSYLPLSRGPSGTKGGDKIGGNRVVNLLQVGGAQQVMLEVKVAEVSRELMKSMDMDFNFINSLTNVQIGAVNGGATFPDVTVGGDGGGRLPIFPNAEGVFSSSTNTGARALAGPVVKEFAPSPSSIDDKGFFMNFLDDNYMFSAVLNIAKENGLAKILAEPTLTTITGQEAKFIAGGEFPIPVPQGVSGTTIEFKEFGVGLGFMPIVLDVNRINIALNVSVSDINSDNSVLLGDENTNAQFFIPSLTKRSVQTTVELADGETLGIAGLISETLRETVNKVPGLGDVPLFGALFRSQEFLKGQTELVIFVTPHFAKPIDKDDIIYPFDDLIEPTDAEFYLLGKLQGEDKPPRHTTPTDRSGFVGTIGHKVGTE
jgi:pilus assembly protein CpaC